ncbi:hypothetical protein STRAU_0299 [Streptomyces aurantiacus JA 4570]|uniref:Uncharacterized protein n=1 Tax=Streptomyces aurantiacus JA 4570 TaxID=1286094 RepID=S4A7A2_9ACTN|nr:hypothetical protein STRAU_0299 [Streptomyces aurantiacus JA 4570]
MHGETAGAGGAADDFEVDAEAGGVVDEVLAIDAVRPALAAAIRSSSLSPAVESWMLAAVTRTVSSRPVVSITPVT